MAKKTLAEDFISLFSELAAVPLNEKEHVEKFGFQLVEFSTTYKLGVKCADGVVPRN